MTVLKETSPNSSYLTAEVADAGGKIDFRIMPCTPFLVIHELRNMKIRRDARAHVRIVLVESETDIPHAGWMWSRTLSRRRRWL
jgi:hypothetical protein